MIFTKDDVSKLWGIFCPTPKDAPACQLTLRDIMNRLEKIERDGSNRAKTLNTITDVLVNHMEREEGNMESYARTTATLTARMEDVLRLLSDTEVDYGS